MGQQTLVLMLRGADGDALRERLESGPFDFRAVPHALFSVRGEGVTATLYRSGKLVVQGADPEGFTAAWVGEAQRAAGQPSAERATPAQVETTVGSDESGKGDYFGPLVVAAVRVTPAEAAKLAQGEVRDSKKVSDASALRLGGALRANLPHAVVRLDPLEYNARYTAVGNLNPILAELHAEAIRALATPGMAVVVDQFAQAAEMERALAATGVRLTQRPRAEELPVVAAASLIAREQFLLGLAELSEESALDLPKGAGEPVDRTAARFVALHGREALGRVAKLHFRNTTKLRVR